MNEGYIKLSRKAFDNWVWSATAASYGQAWIDLIQLARWKQGQGKHVVNGVLIRWERGQLLGSVRFLAERWKWSKSKVQKFLSLLVEDDMIKTDYGQGVTVITICKYGSYNESGEASRTPSGQGADTKRTGSGHQADRERTGSGQNSKKGNKGKESNKVKKGNDDEEGKILDSSSSTPQINIYDFLANAKSDEIFQKSCAKKGFKNLPDLLESFKDIQFDMGRDESKKYGQWRLHFSNWLKTENTHNGKSTRNNGGGAIEKRGEFEAYEKFY